MHFDVVGFQAKMQVVIRVHTTRNKHLLWLWHFLFGRFYQVEGQPAIVPLVLVLIMDVVFV